MVSRETCKPRRARLAAWIAARRGRSRSWLACPVRQATITRSPGTSCIMTDNAIDPRIALMRSADALHLSLTERRRARS
jgi:hypothetical protein